MRKLTLFGAIVCAFRFASAETVWIDTDVSIGSPIREVDDAYALILAFHSSEIRIAGVSTTYGNAPLGQTTRAAQDLVRRFGGCAGLTNSDVYPGAPSPAAIGDRSAASDALAAVLEKRKVTYIALGPLTNLATFVRLHPERAHRIDRVIFLGGQVPGTTLAFGPKRSFHIHDANVFKDPAAAEAVLLSNIPVTFVPIATASNLLLDATDLRKLEESGGPANYLSRQSRIWLWFWTNIVKTKGGPIFDVVALIAATKPGLVSIEKRYAKMDEVGNLLLVRRSLTNGARPVRSCMSFAPETKDFVMRRLMTRRSRE
jgi:pyrimidine-specific ribonucleoside hydrolase